MKRVLINASNLHNGGGIQVAASFITELADLADRFSHLHFSVFVSTEVNANLTASGFSRGGIDSYEVFDIHGLNALNPVLGERFCGFDLVFTIFGPLYCLSSIKNNIVGFAQAWIVYPNNEVGRSFSAKRRLLTRLKFAIQWLFFKRADRLVVELKHVRDGLIREKSFPEERVEVVSNCVSRLFLDRSRWKAVPPLASDKGGVIRLGLVARDYPHKNIGMMLEVAKALSQISPLKYLFFVTLSDDEWMARSEEFRNTVVNVGPITVSQCPSFYESVDGVFFPSLLESFSVTPLEAMVMRRPLFASDRGFVKDCCGSHAIYFDPLNADDAARQIDSWFSDTGESERQVRIDGAYRHVLSLPCAADRASSYLDIIDRQLFRKN